MSKIYLIKSNLNYNLETFVEIVVVASSEEQASKMIPYFEYYYDDENAEIYHYDQKERVSALSVELSQTGDFIIPKIQTYKWLFTEDISETWAKNVNDLTITEVGIANDNFKVGQVISAYFHHA